MHEEERVDKEEISEDGCAESTDEEVHTVQDPAPIQNRQHMLPPVYGGPTVWQVLGAGIFIGAAAMILLSNRT